MDRPFTLEEATDIAEDFSDLEGTGIIMDIGTDTISCQVAAVVAAPYAGTERAAFDDAYKRGVSTEVMTNYTGDQYEVVIIGINTTDNSAVMIPIRNYTRAYGVRYNYP